MTALCLSSVLILAGCSAKPTISTETSSAPAAASATPAPTPVAGGELKINMPKITAGDGGMHPLITPYRDMIDVLGLVYESPLRYDDNHKLSANLVESWEVDEAGTTWTFKLRDNIQWQKGYGQLTSDDVLYSFDVVKNNEESFYSAAVSRFASYEKVDDLTFKVTTSTPYYGVLHAMTLPIVCRAYFTTHSSGVEAPGTGPYAFESMDGNGINFTVNENWWKREPYITKIRAVMMEDDAAAFAAYDAGELDVVASSSYTANKYKNRADQVVDYGTQQYDFMAMSLYREIFQDVRVRQAVCYAVDIKEIITKAYMSQMIEADIPLNPSSFYYDHTLEGYDRDLPKARQLLAEAGYSDANGDGVLEKGGSNLSFTILTDLSKTDTVHDDAAFLLAKQLEEAGFEVKVLTLDWEAFNERVTARNFDALLTSFYVDEYPDLTFCFFSSGVSNLNAFRVSEVDEALNAQHKYLTPEAYRTGMSTLHAMLVRQAPYVSIGFRTNTIVAKTAVRGIKTGSENHLYQNIDQWYIAE